MGGRTKTTAHMLLRQSRRRQTRQAIVSLAVVLLVYYIALWFMGQGRSSNLPPSSHRAIPPGELPLSSSSLSLTEQQCRTAFPGLTDSIDDVVAEGPFEVKDTGDLGPLQGRIKDGKVGWPATQQRTRVLDRYSS